MTVSTQPVSGLERGTDARRERYLCGFQGCHPQAAHGAGGRGAFGKRGKLRVEVGASGRDLSGAGVAGEAGQVRYKPMRGTGLSPSVGGAGQGRLCQGHRALPGRARVRPTTLRRIVNLAAEARQVGRHDGTPPAQAAISAGPSRRKRSAFGKRPARSLAQQREGFPIPGHRPAGRGCDGEHPHFRGD